MKGGKSPLGYTIIEVMIVLAVSGVMFIIATNFISGKESHTAFNSGVNELASRIQDTIDQVTDGQYSDINLHCYSTGSGIAIDTVGATSQGTNADCFFLGKVMHFSVNSDPEKYDVLSLAGARLNSSSKPVLDLGEASPTVIGPLTINQTVPQSLDVFPMTINNSATQNYGLAFIQEIVPGGDSALGAQQPPSLYYVNGMGVGVDASGAVTAINTSSSLQKASSFKLCVSDGTRRATISVGADSGQLNVKVKMLGEVASC